MKIGNYILASLILKSSMSMANPAIDCYKKAMDELFNRNNVGISAAVVLCNRSK